MEPLDQKVSPDSIALQKQVEASTSISTINIDSSGNILELPVEILTYILSCFNNEKDVLSVSTTYSIFYEIMLKENPAVAFVRLRTAIPSTFFGERNLGRELMGVSVSSGKHLRTIKDQDATNLSSISNDKIAIFNRSTKEDRDHELIKIFSLNTAALLAAFKIPINDRLNGDRVVMVRFENVSKRTYLLVGENHGKLIVFLLSNHEKRENIL
jgi:hypothetical protein